MRSWPARPATICIAIAGWLVALRGITPQLITNGRIGVRADVISALVIDAATPIDRSPVTGPIVGSVGPIATQIAPLDRLIIWSFLITGLGKRRRCQRCGDRQGGD